MPRMIAVAVAVTAAVALSLAPAAADPATAPSAASPATAPLAEAVLSPEQAREDLRVFRGALEESHVGLHWFVPKPELDRRFDQAAAELTRPITPRAFHRLLLPIVAGLGHGHTTLSLPTTGVGYRLRPLDRDRRYLPLDLRVLAGRLYVKTDCSADAAVPAGSEVVAVDGRPVAALLDEMLGYCSADGGSRGFKEYQLGGDFRFHYLLDLLHGPADAFAVRYVPPGRVAPVARTVAALPPQRIADLYKERTGTALDTFGPPLSYEPLDGGGQSAVLRVRSFYEGYGGWNAERYRAALGDAFRRAKADGVRHLVVDVRDNEGGAAELAILLYRYLADKPFRPGGPTELASATLSYLKYADGVSDDVRQFAVTPDKFVERTAAGAIVLRPEFDRENQQVYAPEPDAFAGRLYVLTNGGSFSATNAFLDLVARYHRLAKRPVWFVGRENGGASAFDRASGGQTLPIVLPHSRQRLTIPLLGGRKLTGGDGSRVAIPDREVVPTIADLLSGADPELRYVRDELIATGK